MVFSTMHLNYHVAYLGDVLLLNYNFQSLEAIWLFDHWASSNSLTNRLLRYLFLTTLPAHKDRNGNV